MKTKYPHVFRSIRIRGVDFKNRIELAPPSPNRADKDGRVCREFVDWFRPFARGGAATVHVGNSVIDSEESSDEERQLDVGNDGSILPLSTFSEMCDTYGAHASLELNHCGIDSNPSKIGRPAISASSLIMPAEKMRAEAENRDPVASESMSKEKIKETVEKYADAAYRCKKAGMKICMIHGGHGNLISQFASTLFNKRTDEYGGSLENRSRFCLEVLDRVREKVGENFVIEFRISADEIHPEGMHFEETLRFIELIKDKIDILHVSAGLHGDFAYFRYWWQNALMDHKYNVHFAEKIKKRFPDLLVCTVGSIMSIADAEEIIASGKADFVAMCRPLIADPSMPRKYALGLEEEHRPCIRCQKCGGRLIMPRVIGCAVNPYSANIDQYPDEAVPKSETRKKVAVIGGGPAGIQATLTLCERDHNVTLYEKTGELGGNLLGAAAPAFKTDMKTYLDYLIRQVKRSPAAISYNTEATKELLDEANYDSIVIAVGADPVFPKVPGIDQSHVQWASDADRGLVETGNKIVVIGAGAIGVETAIGLSASGKDVEIIEMAGDLNHLMMNSSNTMEDLMDMIQKQQIPIHLNTRLKEIKSDRIICDHRQTGDETEYFSDTVLLAVGMKPRWDLVDQLRNSAPETEVFVIGDAVEVATLFEAVNSGFKAAAAI